MSEQTIVNADCLEHMRTLPDKSFDLVLTDPPYGIGEAAGKNKGRGKMAVSKDYGDMTWDNAIPSKEIFQEIFRVSKKQIIFGGNYFVEYLTNSPAWLVWDKDNGDTDFADCELAWTNLDMAVRKIKYRWQGMLQENMKNKEFRYHPTQKPVAVMSWAAKFYDGSILDPFMGSGTTLVAAKLLNRNAVGVEISAEYCAIAKQRLRQEVLL